MSALFVIIIISIHWPRYNFSLICSLWTDQCTVWTDSVQYGLTSVLYFWQLFTLGGAVYRMYWPVCYIFHPVIHYGLTSAYYVLTSVHYGLTSVLYFSQLFSMYWPLYGMHWPLCYISASCSLWADRCDSGECLFFFWFCDGEADCIDGSDETKCSK